MINVPRDPFRRSKSILEVVTVSKRLKYGAFVPKGIITELVATIFWAVTINALHINRLTDHYKLLLLSNKEYEGALSKTTQKVTCNTILNDH